MSGRRGEAQAEAGLDERIHEWEMVARCEREDGKGAREEERWGCE